VAGASQQCSKIDLRMARKKQWPAAGGGAEGRTQDGNWRRRTAGARKFNVQRRGPCGFQLRGDGNIFVFPRHLRVVRTTLAAHRLCFASCVAASSFGHVLLLHLIFNLRNQVPSIVLKNLTKILGPQT
jgi:hypothetical protein